MGIFPSTQMENNGPYAPIYETFAGQYAPTGPMPELAMSLSLQPRGPAPQSPRTTGALRGVQDAETWYAEALFDMQAARQANHAG
jgi:hypothetical protein